MKKYKVYQSRIFTEKLKNMPKNFKEWIEKIQDQFISNPYVGKPLGVDWLREKNMVNTEFIILFMKILLPFLW